MRDLLIKQKVNDKVDEITDFIIIEYQMPLTAINYANRMLDFILELKIIHMHMLFVGNILKIEAHLDVLFLKRNGLLST
jgi:hypothetical protein